MILLITNKADVHPNPVIDYFNQHNIPFFRLNTECLLTDYTFEYQLNNSHSDIHIRCVHNNLKCRVSEITAVWERRPKTPNELFYTDTENINEHNLKEATGFLNDLRYYLKDIPSIGSIQNDDIAQAKILQYKYALECGLNVPSTIIANTKKAIVDFAKHHNELILKPIKSCGIQTGEEEYIFYSTKLSIDTLDDLPDETFSQTLNFIQEYIPKQFELRITIVGKKLFAVKIDTQHLDDLEGKVDWRQADDEHIKYSDYSLPTEIEDKLLMLLDKLGLNFGCIDMIVSHDGSYTFLECNPNGQWLWLEIVVKQDISGAIAEWLVKQ